MDRTELAQNHPGNPCWYEAGLSGGSVLDQIYPKGILASLHPRNNADCRVERIVVEIPTLPPNS